MHAKKVDGIVKIYKQVSQIRYPSLTCLYSLTLQAKAPT